MHLIHNNLASLSAVAAKESGRYSVCGVRLTLRDDGGYRAEATDLKILARVEGRTPAIEPPHAHPSADTLATAPNGATEATVPSKSWKEAMKAAPRKKGLPARLRTVAVALNEKVATLASSDCATQSVEQGATLEGRFPDTDSVIPKKPRVKITFDAEALERLLAVARDVATNDGVCRVTMEITDENTAAVLRAERAEQTFTGVIMPLTSK